MSKKTISFFVLACFAFALCGCNEQPVQFEPLQTRGNVIIKNGTIKHFKRESPYVNNNITDEPEELDQKNSMTQMRAQLIAEKVTQVNNVHKASVTLNNNTAIIGIEISDTVGSDELIKIKNAVEEAVRSADGGIERVAVSASKELMERLMKNANFVSEESPLADPESGVGKLIEQLTPVV